MSFVFASSHLPEVKRPDDGDEEEEDVQPMQRSGMVRAFSHLPQRVQGAPAAPRPSGQAPAPASRPAWAAAPEAPSGHESDDGHDPEPDDDADEGHGSSAETGAHEPDDGRPWYLPRITAADLQPEGGEHDPDPGFSIPPEKPVRDYNPDPGFSIPPEKPVRDYNPDPGFYIHPSKTWGKPTPDAGFDASPQDIRDDPRSPAPDTTAAAPAARSAALPYGRLFEKRPTPGFSAPTGRPGFNDLVYRTQGGPAEAKDRAGGLFQNVADTRGAAKDELATRAKAIAQRAGQMQPKRGGSTNLVTAQHSTGTPAQSIPPAPGGAEAAPPPLKIHDADENAEVVLKDPATGRISKPTFGDHVRSVMRDEIQNSPTARALLKHATEMTGKPVIIKMAVNGQEAQPQIGLDGSLTVFVNPGTLRSGTLSHEIAHAIQGWAVNAWSKQSRGRSMKSEQYNKEFTDAVLKGRKDLHAVVPVMYDGISGGNGNQDGTGDGVNYRENEAMRAANIVNAELDAAKMKAELDLLQKSDKTAHAAKTPAEIERDFWDRRSKNENVGHQNNQKLPGTSTGMAVGTRYGNYDFKHVNEVLGHGVKVQNSMPLR